MPYMTVNEVVDLARHIPDPDRGWVWEGAQQSCGCAGHPVCIERLRGVETSSRPSLFAGRSGALRHSNAGSPVDTRRTRLCWFSSVRDAQTRVVKRNGLRNGLYADSRQGRRVL